MPILINKRVVTESALNIFKPYFAITLNLTTTKQNFKQVNMFVCNKAQCYTQYTGQYLRYVFSLFCDSENESVNTTSHVN